MAANITEQTDSQADDEIYLALEHVQSWTGVAHPPDGKVDFASTVKKFSAGDILFGKLRPYLAKVTRARCKGVCVSEFLVLRPRLQTTLAVYLERILCSKHVIDFINSSTVGAKMPRAEWSFIGNVRLPVPPLDEQNRIAAWLRAQDARIARYIQQRRALMRRLDEQKRTLISHAVTRGLDAAAPLKPSGVQWLGDVPAHWEVRRLKSLAANITEQTDSQANDEIYLALEHVQSWTGAACPPDGNVDFSSTVKKFSAGDILFGKLRPYLAKVTRARCKGVCVSEFLVLRSNTQAILPVYLEQMLRSKNVIDLINSSTAGAKMPRAEWAFIGNVRLPVPPLEEQHAICRYIEEQSRPLDDAIASLEKEIALVLEYRQRQISDAVTGQIDLRGWQPGPDDVAGADMLAVLDDGQNGEEDDGEEE